MAKPAVGANTWLGRMRNRLQSDFQFAMIVAFGLLAVIAVSGFAIFRFMTGHIYGAMINLCVVFLVSGVLTHAVVSGNSERSGLLFAVVSVLSVLVSALVFGITALSWSYLVLWINFILTERRRAAAINGFLILALLLMPGLFASSLAVITFLITSLLVTAFAYIFAWRLSDQQSQLEQMASRDPLTRVGNRRSMRQDLIQAVDEHARSNRDFTLMLLDLDHFKKLNDEHGHDAGDQALRQFADLLRTHVRIIDGVYRFGGEEFVLLFRDTGAEVADRLTRTLHANTSGTLDGPGGRLHFSAGVAVLRPGEDMDQWLRRADQALYRAKEAGRARLEVCD